ncbi:hypothetical protein GCWU000323_01278 [Leptotrichia hofstadii F0254]|uniref:Uncharacterized protein n=1 Tax=Leptotrichia hofstadii F0254 TaxID=634994 RepID=C9MXN0_9FUSO|nr:hypothetical protein GCWU000323_01278 [Leptotrichia hofstadii F0254]
MKYLDKKKYFRKKEYDFKNFEKIEKNFVIVLKINGKCDKLNKLLNKRIFRFYCCYQFCKGFISKKSF